MPEGICRRQIVNRMDASHTTGAGLRSFFLPAKAYGIAGDDSAAGCVRIQLPGMVSSSRTFGAMAKPVTP